MEHWFHNPILAVLYPRSLNAECLLRAGGWRNGLEEPEGGEEEEIIERTKASFCSNPSFSVLVLRNDPTVLIKWLSFSSPPISTLLFPSIVRYMYIVTEKAKRESWSILSFDRGAKSGSWLKTFIASFSPCSKSLFLGWREKKMEANQAK